MTASGAAAVANGPSLSGMVDWDLAVSTARRLLRNGPEASRSEASSAVASLHRYVEQADDHVQRITKLSSYHPTERVSRVVDRFDWVRLNVAGLTAFLEPIVLGLETQRAIQPGRIAATVGPKATGLQAGAVLAFVSRRVLGQYEVLTPGQGQLLLVAPNIVEVERLLGVDPADFRLWVCLHEATHRLQFTAVQWLRAHLHQEIGELVTAIELDPDALRERVSHAVHDLASAIRHRQNAGQQGVIAVLHSPAQREILDRLTALMSLLEGHAEYVMDAVGPDVVPSARVIRQRFTKRRKGGGPLDKLLRRALGLDAKVQQYARGQTFVRKVVGTVDIDGFNAVWSSPETLPTMAEINAPEQWIRRIHGF